MVIPGDSGVSIGLQEEFKNLSEGFEVFWERFR